MGVHVYYLDILEEMKSKWEEACREVFVIKSILCPVWMVHPVSEKNWAMQKWPSEGALLLAQPAKRVFPFLSYQVAVCPAKAGDSAGKVSLGS